MHFVLSGPPCCITNAGFLDTQVAAHAETHQFDKAIAGEQEAGLGKSEPDKKDYALRLILYQANKPYRVPANP